ncbi:uncharacterized protein LOC106638574 [Copidosoma floridanum]|uniref:uncharacterized protein LOC106638574 n=1 Tax=Copidosoma floridanum TaxID=29053 RepID=UPI0006C9DD33|nr:uncharacterized protein LOC106638574 [Copidosoma floridanum]
MALKSYKPTVNEIKRVETVEHFAYLWSVGTPRGIDGTEDVASECFSAGARTWELHLYPNSKCTRSKDKDCLAMDLTMTGETELVVRLCVSMIDRKRQKVVRSWRARKILFQPNEPLVINRLIKLDFVDEVTKEVHVLCEIWPDEADEPKNAEEENGSKMEEKQYKCQRFLNNKKCSDVALLIGDRKILAHSIVLATRSSVFAVVLGDFVSRKNKLASTQLMIKCTPYNVMMALIRYMYHGDVDGVEEVANQLMVAAFEYGVWDLIHVCEMVLLKNLSQENAFDYLKSAVKCDALYLKINALKLLTELWLDDKNRKYVVDPTIYHLEDDSFVSCLHLSHH